MKKVLIITYYWPPAGGPGVQRWLNFVKFLPENNIEPVLFIPKDPNYPIIDESLCKEIDSNLSIIKFPINEISNFLPKYNFLNSIRSGNVPVPKKQSLFQKLLFFIRGNLFIPDMKLFWIKKSADFLKNYLKKNKIETIITTGPPHSIHLIGLDLKNTLNINWIADFRDPWVNLNYLNRFHLLSSTKKRHKELRDKVLNNADTIIVTSERLRKLYKKFSTNVFNITNGYNHNKYKIELDEKFSISHIGSLYDERNPSFLWNVIEEMYEDIDNFKNDFQINLIGNTSKKIKNNLNTKKFHSCINYYDYVNHNHSIQLMGSSQALLLIEANDFESSYAIPGKLFEYLNSRRPIIAVGPSKSDVSKILSKTKSGKFFCYNEGSYLKRYLQEIYDNYKLGRKQFKSKGIELYDRRNLTKRLAKILNDL